MKEIKERVREMLKEIYDTGLCYEDMEHPVQTRDIITSQYADQIHAIYLSCVPEEEIELLQKLIVYYLENRTVGHTYTMLNGAVNNANALVVVDNMAQAKQLPIPRQRIITLEGIKNHALEGRQQPLAFDNFALMSLFGEIVKAISQTRKNMEK